MKAKLVLENGAVFEGVSIGQPGEKVGEVVLYTGVVGYQEVITDPANAGKIVVFTYPLIGNYGTAKKFYESKKAWPAAVIIKEVSKIYSNWQAETSFEDFIKKEGLSVISEVDTRTLAVEIRDNGQMIGAISTRETNVSNLVKKLKGYKKSHKIDFIKNISVKNITKMNKNPNGPKIAILDLGITKSFVTQLENLGCDITLLPYNTTKDVICELNPDGLIISNGPEQDESVDTIVKSVKQLIGEIPILGICAGHEVIWRALGGRLKKMKLGHRGVNYPVKAPSSNKGDITVQNHSFVADEKSLKNKSGVKITLRNVNDDTVEEMESAGLKFISTQYQPVSPGFDEPNNVFVRFLEMTAKNKKGTKGSSSRGNSGSGRKLAYAKA